MHTIHISSYYCPLLLWTRTLAGETITKDYTQKPIPTKSTIRN